MSRDKILYEEGYKKGACTLDKEKLLLLIHRNNPDLLSAEVKKSGIMERNKKKTEYIDMRVYFEARTSE